MDLPVAVKMFRFEGDEGGKIRKNATTLVLRAAEIKTRSKNNANCEQTNSKRKLGVKLNRKVICLIPNCVSFEMPPV